MTSANLKEPPPQVPAAKVAARFKPSEAARALLSDDPPCKEFLQRLVARKLYADAIRLLAHLLSKRSAIWWAALCTWEACRPQPDDAANAVFQLVVDWVKQPDDTRRRQAMMLARAAGVNTPVGLLGSAVFFSTGSIAPPDAPEVLPDAWESARLVAAAVQAAGHRLAASQQGKAQAHLIQLGVDVAAHKLPWASAGPEPQQQAPPT